MDLQPHEQRVVDELKELQDKKVKSYKFQTTDIYKSLSDREKRLLKDQYHVMLLYARILEERIGLFKKK